MRDVILDTVTFGDTVSKGALLAELDPNYGWRSTKTVEGYYCR